MRQDAGIYYSKGDIGPRDSCTRTELTDAYAADEQILSGGMP
jgi:hypothetical protein